MERLEVLQQKLEHWCATSVRALAAEPTAHYRGHGLLVQGKPFHLYAPHLQLDFATHDATKLRGVADSIALRIIHSNQKLHESLCPKDPLQRLIFEILEQLRCESLATSNLPGIRTNLRNRFLFWASQTAASKLTENNIGILIYSLTIVCWSRLLIQAIPEQIEEMIEATRWGFADTIGRHLRSLKSSTVDQQSFSIPALQIAEIISDMTSANDSQPADAKEADEKTVLALVQPRQLNMKWLDGDNPLVQSNQGVSQIDALSINLFESDYKVFSRRYDKEISATKSIRKAQLLKLRAQLDKRIRKQSVNVPRVARRLQQLIAIPALSAWSFGEEQGYLDSARLARLVSSPDERRLFKQDAEKPSSSCVISILVDNSGSMTHHNEAAAAMVDTLARTMEMASIKTEVLGFTTGEWNGGKVFKEWQAAGKPENPGRLNSLCHTIYKSAETPWRRARKAISGMLKSDAFREGIDGEALQWAANRIEERSEKDKIILVVSDGSPMDTATHAANSERYLDKHLAYVAQSIEARPDIRLCGLGVGLDLSTYYSSNHSISLDGELCTHDFVAIAELLSRAV